VSGRQLLRTFHRWLGAALCLLFLTWFATGIVMTFAGFPRVGERDKLAHAEALRQESIRIPPSALKELATGADAIELHALGSRALYTVRNADRTSSVFADSGERLSHLDEGTLRSIASGWLHATLSDSAQLNEVDQWTPQANRHGQLPFGRFRAYDEAGTEIYVSYVDGEVVQLTSARTRLLAWVGAIPHWIYPIQLRKHASAWRTLVIALSGLGALVSGSGLVHGLSVARIARRSARRTPLSVSPFQDPWLAWHHRLGLSFGLLAFTWVLSGMLSFFPFARAAQSDPTAADVAAFRGAALDPRSFTRDLGDTLGHCQRSLRGAVKRVELLMAGGSPFYVCSDGSGASRILRANDSSPPSVTLATATMARFVRPLGKGAAVESETLLQERDDYYYPTHFGPELAFPVLRTRFASGLVTYVSPGSLRVVRRYSSSGTAYRWLYPGLHSLDFPALYQRAWLWHPLIVGLLLGGGALAASGVWLSLRAATGRAPRRWRVRRINDAKPNHSEVDAS
jgi:hypothetical protein